MTTTTTTTTTATTTNVAIFITTTTTTTHIISIIGTKGYTPEITKVKFHRKAQLKSIGSFQWKSIGEVTILWNMQVTSEILLDNYTENSSGNAIDNPR